MRFDSFLLLCFVLGAILVFVQSEKSTDEDEGVQDDEEQEESRSSSTTKAPTRMKK